ncbi:MAG: Crp/Fnr family transcriptional regulator [Pseudomonadota bacterium]
MAVHDSKQMPPSTTDEPELCANCAIRHSSLCGALSSAEILDLNAIARRKKLEAGQSHVMEGDEARDFANVTDGVAKLVKGSEDGRAQILGLLFPSDFIGGTLGAASRDEPHSIEAVTDLELCLFPRHRFESLLHQYPALEFKLLNRTLNELQVAREWMVLLGRKTAEERVASFLLNVSEKMRNSGCTIKDAFDLPLGRSDIADYLGLTLETVSRQISRLKKDGIIKVEGVKRVTFVDEDRLRDRARF